MINFSEAAGRHWCDGEILHKAARYENADHLFGFAAECAIKAAVRHGNKVDPVGDIDERFKCHINILWNRIPAQQFTRNYPGLAALLRCDNPFSDWDVAQRYSADGVVTKDSSDTHRKMTQRILGAAQVLGARAGARNG